MSPVERCRRDRQVSARFPWLETWGPGILGVGWRICCQGQHYGHTAIHQLFAERVDDVLKDESLFSSRLIEADMQDGCKSVSIDEIGQEGRYLGRYGGVS